MSYLHQGFNIWYLTTTKKTCSDCWDIFSRTKSPTVPRRKTVFVEFSVGFQEQITPKDKHPSIFLNLNRGFHWCVFLFKHFFLNARSFKMPKVGLQRLMNSVILPAFYQSQAVCASSLARAALKQYRKLETNFPTQFTVPLANTCNMQSPIPD